MRKVSGVGSGVREDVRLRELMECIEEIQQFTAGMSLDEFLADKLSYQATLKNLQLIGNCVHTIPLDQRKRFPDVPWQCIGSLGRKIIRSRYGINSQVLWNMLWKELPTLKDAVTVLISAQEVVGSGKASVLPGLRDTADHRTDQPA